tara:strand:- start:2547 stop:3422 length:876 start_codon:yes stop_codon:yes gene_type:complete
MKKITEKNNNNSNNIDSFSTKNILKTINSEDSNIPAVINKSINDIEKVVNSLVKVFNNNGKLFYVGCGTSGRLGILDAVECPPTFSTPIDMVQGIIAGGNKAIYESVENAEDSDIDAIKIIREKISNKDFVIGISASGSANYVLAALKESCKLGAKTCLITCNEFKKEKFFNHLIELIVGPEIISGSTRMKAGTATKMVLNMITTTTMIRINKTYGNYMVDLKVSNEKLKIRAVNIVKKLTGLNIERSEKILEKANNNVKAAIVMQRKNVDYDSSLVLLNKMNGNLRSIIG